MELIIREEASKCGRREGESYYGLDVLPKIYMLGPEPPVWVYLE